MCEKDDIADLRDALRVCCNEARILREQNRKAMELIDELCGYAKQAWGWKYGAEWDAEIKRLKGGE